jgi:hypothetical protein
MDVEKAVVIKRRGAFLAFACCCCAFLSCQKASLENVTSVQVAARLQQHVGQPYGVGFQITRKAVPSSPGNAAHGGGEEARTWVFEGEYFQASEWVSCWIEKGWINDYFMWTTFIKQMNGLTHILQESQDGSMPMWECVARKKKDNSLPAPGYYPHGGWDLCSRASALLEDYPPSHMEVKDSEIMMTWNSIPSELGLNLLTTYFLTDDAENVGPIAVNSLFLAVDYERGVPTAYGLTLSTGESLTTTYADFEFLEGNYLDRIQELRSKMNVPEYIRCWCDGPIYDVTLPLPEY